MVYVIPTIKSMENLRKQLNSFFADIDARLPLTGAGSPEGVVTAGQGALYQRTDGGATTSLYVKTSGTGNTGWTAK